MFMHSQWRIMVRIVLCDISLGEPFFPGCASKNGCSGIFLCNMLASHPGRRRGGGEEGEKMFLVTSW